MITFTEILSCNGTVLFQQEGSQLEFSTSGTLSLLLAYDGMVLLKLNDFEYGINPADEIPYDDKDPQFSFIFYLSKYPKGTWVLKVNEHGDEMFSCLSEKGYLRNRRGPIKGRVKGKVEEEGKVLGNVPRNMGGEEKQEEQSIFVGASKQLNKGLKFTGGVLSKGFENLGTFISKKVDKQEKVEISKDTNENLKLAKNTTKNVLTFTAEQVGNLFKFGKNIASDIGDRFEKSQKGKEMQENENYESVKKGTKTGVKVFANVFDGFVNGVYEVGSGIAKGATKIIGAKYGTEAEGAADQALEGAGNVAKIVRTPYDQAAESFK